MQASLQEISDKSRVAGLRQSFARRAVRACTEPRIRAVAPQNTSQVRCLAEFYFLPERCEAARVAASRTLASEHRLRSSSLTARQPAKAKMSPRMANSMTRLSRLLLAFRQWKCTALFGPSLRIGATWDKFHSYQTPGPKPCG
jgi:hypothetical protein